VAESKSIIERSRQLRYLLVGRTGELTKLLQGKLNFNIQDHHRDWPGKGLNSEQTSETESGERLRLIQ
jgi:hypothetical protein